MNPVFSKEDITFVCERIRGFRETLKTRDKRGTNGEGKNMKMTWQGDKPYLRMYHTIIVDRKMMDAFANCQKTLSRSELDGRNSDKQSVSFYELLAEKYNDPSFVVSSFALPHIYSLFKNSILLNLDDCPKMSHLSR